MDKAIRIPNFSPSDRIGSTFNNLFGIICQTEVCASNDVVWDFSEVTYSHPFFLAPLAIYKYNCPKNIKCINIPLNISSYFKLVHFESPLHLSDCDKVKDTLAEYREKSYIPICRIELSRSNVDSLQTELQRIIKYQSKADSRITTPLSYLLGELIDNMNEHSCSKYGYIYAQYLKFENCINLVIADNGITIYGSYVRSGKYQEYIKDGEAEALRLAANEGLSTKNLPNAENRGYGLSSSKKMLVDGLNGAFFMLSGGAFHRHDNKGSEFVKLPKVINWDGTVVLLKIPVQIPSDFNYNNYTR